MIFLDVHANPHTTTLMMIRMIISMIFSMRNAIGLIAAATPRISKILKMVGTDHVTEWHIHFVFSCSYNRSH